MKKNIILAIAAALCIYSGAANAQYYPYSALRIYNDRQMAAAWKWISASEKGLTAGCTDYCTYEDLYGTVEQRWNQCQDLIREMCQAGCKVVVLHSFRGGLSGISHHPC
jgi:hypothetical protein